MKIAFMHFHLQTGGVTSVLRQQVAALQAAGVETLVLSGHQGSPPLSTPWEPIPGLAYDGQRDASLSALDVADAISSAIRTHWPRGADVLHVHNPTLAKNNLLQEILGILHNRGQRLLGQIHDFAEDGRPDFFFQQPYTPDCHYAVLNKRDYNLLLGAGLEATGVHLLPNPVKPLGPGAEHFRPPSTQVLYPVRALRRKNIGEALLLSLFFKPASHLAITLPPNSVQDIRSYRGWRAFARQNRLNASFDVGLGHDFQSLIADCRFILTTSITEGFGYAFLEGWTADRIVWGRLLPEICRDFIDQGIRLDHMYTRLAVPLEWMAAQALAQHWQKALAQAAARLGQAVPQQDLQAAWKQVSSDGLIDFGLLNETFQQQVILRLVQDRRAGAALININRFLAQASPGPGLESMVAGNRQRIEAYYHPDNYARRLLDIYSRVMNTAVTHKVDKAVLARRFLSPHTFSLLKWEPYHGDHPV